MTTPRSLSIEVVSDVVCPWCAIGLRSLEIALQRLDGVVDARVRMLPFQLNPLMPPEGEEIVEHLSRKYGLDAAAVRANQDAIAERGAAVGFEFRMDRRGRTWNTFDAHRLLRWAEPQGRQLALKHALLGAYFTDGENVSDPEVLVRCANRVGLDADGARALLAGNDLADEVRTQLRQADEWGIRSVPTFVVDRRAMIQGGHPPELFEQALRQLAAA